MRNTTRQDSSEPAPKCGATSLAEAAFRKLLPYHWISWKAGALPLRAIGNAADEKERDQLVNIWVKMILYQLSNVQLTGAILSAVIVGGFSWPLLSSTTATTLSILQSLWFSSLMTSIAAVAVAIHQSVFLARLASVTGFEAILADILCYEASDGHHKVRQEQTFIWLLAVGLLEWSIGLWLGGYVVFLWDITKMGKHGQGSLDISIACLSALALFLSIFLYFFSVIRLWQGVLKAKSHLKLA